MNNRYINLVPKLFNINLNKYVYFLSAICFLLSSVAIFCIFYKLPSAYNGDTLHSEAMYRDLFINNGALNLWGYAGALHYIEQVIYFMVRFLTDNLYVTMASLAALIAVLISFSGLYLIYPFFQTSEAKSCALFLSPVFALLISMAFLPASEIISTWIIHAITLIGTFLCMGLFIRIILKNNYILASLLFISITLLATNDKLFIVSFCLPTLFMLMVLFFNNNISLKKNIILILLILISTYFGTVLENSIRNFPTPFSPFHSGFIKFLKTLYFIVSNSVMLFKANIWQSIIFLTGFIGFIIALFNNKLRLISLYCLSVMIINICIVSFTGYHHIRYIFTWYLLPCFVGFLIFIDLISKNKNFAKPLSLVLSLLCFLFISYNTYSFYKNIRTEDFYPKFLQELDELALKKNFKTGLADYNNTRIINIFSKQGLEFVPLVNYGFNYYFDTDTKAILKDKYDILLFENIPDPYSMVNRDLEINQNGPPDETMILSNNIEILLYKNTFIHPSEAEILLNGAKLVPQMAKGDATFNQSLVLNNELRINKFMSMPRQGKHLLVMFFDAPQKDILGDNFQIFTSGDRTTSYRRKLMQKVADNPDSWLNDLYLLFVPDRKMTITKENSAQLADGTSIAWGKMASWDSKIWHNIVIKHLDKLYKINTSD